MKRLWTISFAAAAAASLAACVNMGPPPPPPPPPPPVAAVPAPAATLYQQLGGLPAIQAVVKDFVENEVAPDPRINRFFVPVIRRHGVQELEAAVVDQICQATGGPCVYKGPPMPVVHRGMHITDADFGAFVEDLVKSLNKFHVPPPLQQQLLGILGPLKPQIVGL
jgi:hemoglobin